MQTGAFSITTLDMQSADHGPWMEIAGSEVLLRNRNDEPPLQQLVEYGNYQRRNRHTPVKIKPNPEQSSTSGINKMLSTVSREDAGVSPMQ